MHPYATALVLGLLALPGAATAQNPTADEMIRALRPGGGGTRGIRELGAPGAAPPPAAYAPSPATYAPPPAGPAASPAGAALVPDRAGRAAAPRRPGPLPARQGGSASPRTPAAPVSASPAQAPSVNLSVSFRSGSTDLTPGAMRTLDDLGRALTSAALQGYRFRVEGHTDTVGDADMNKALSERRAAAVADYLTVKWKVDRSRIESAGMGQDHLLVPTGPNVAEPANRRVTVINLGA